MIYFKLFSFPQNLTLWIQHIVLSMENPVIGLHVENKGLLLWFQRVKIAGTSGSSSHPKFAAFNFSRNVHMQ
jgi:hypothetical protein